MDEGSSGLDLKDCPCPGEWEPSFWDPAERPEPGICSSLRQWWTITAQKWVFAAVPAFVPTLLPLPPFTLASFPRRLLNTPASSPSFQASFPKAGSWGELSGFDSGTNPF